MTLSNGGDFVTQASGGLRSRNDSVTSLGSQGRWSRTVSGTRTLVSQEEAEFHKQKTELATAVLKKLTIADDGDEFDKADGSDGLEPPTADVPDAVFKRRLLVNEVLAATEDYMWNVQWHVGGCDLDDGKADGGKLRTNRQARSCLALGYLGQEARAHPAISKALEDAVAERDLLFKAAAFGEFVQRPAPTDQVAKSASVKWDRAISAPDQVKYHRDVSDFDKDSSLKSLKRSLRNASAAHDEVKHLLKTDGIEMGRLMPPSHEKPVLKDPMGIQCVSHLHDPKWTKLARAIRESIYDPDFYDDGTYGPMYVRLAIHGAATWDKTDQTGGLEGAAMRFKPEYSDAHNKFCKEVIKRQHELLKVPFPWASYADIQCLSSYVALECAHGPVIPFAPGRRDVIEPKNLKESIPKPDGDDFVVLNYRERGDAGCEDEPVKCPASGKSGDCPFMRKMRVMPGRVPGPEQGHLGKPGEPVTPENEKKELKEVAKYIRKVFVDRIGASEQHTVALIAGGHSLGRCHPQISGYAGPWQSNPGYFNNVYCKKLLSEDWKIVDRNMEDCSGDMITGLKPYGMRRQYVNKGGKGDLMMLVSDMALREDEHFGYWIQEYALDNEKLRTDFGAAFKWITELGFEPPKEKRGVAKLLFNIRKWKADALKWIGENICSTDDAGASSGPVFLPADAAKVGNPYTMQEVEQHASQQDCWVAINGKVCNLTEFMSVHPGGVQPIMSKAGKDATADWNAIHNRDAIEKIAPHVVVGYLVASK